MLTLQELHDGQNHSFSNLSKELLKLSAMENDTAN